MQKWRTVTSNIIFQHPRLTLAEDEVELPNGKTTLYLKYQGGADAVTIIVVRDDGRLLLQTEYSYPPDEVLWQFPGGGVEANERIAEAAERELAEEVGLQASTWRELGAYYPNNRRSAAKMYVFLATGLTSVQAEGDPEEFIESYWKTTDEIERMIASGDIVNHSVLAAWSLYRAKM